MLLRQKDKQNLLKFFSELNIPVEVWAYGSRVNETAHEGSDLDLVIRNLSRTHGISPLPSDIYMTLCEKIKDSNIPVLVELRDWAMLPESFHHTIEQHHEVLFDNRNLFTPANQQNTVNEPPAEYKKRKNDSGDVENK